MRRRKRYLDNTAPADNTANVVRPVNRMIQVKQQDTPARREKETRGYQAKVEQGQRIMSTFARTPAGRRAANRAYAIESQKAKQEAAKEEAAAVVGSLFKPLMPSTYIDMAAGIKNGQVRSLTDALAAPYLSDSWSMRNPGKALVADIFTPVIGKPVYEVIGGKFGKLSSVMDKTLRDLKHVHPVYSSNVSNLYVGPISNEAKQLIAQAHALDIFKHRIEYPTSNFEGQFKGIPIMLGRDNLIRNTLGRRKLAYELEKQRNPNWVKRNKDYNDLINAAEERLNTMPTGQYPDYLFDQAGIKKEVDGIHLDKDKLSGTSIAVRSRLPFKERARVWRHEGDHEIDDIVPLTPIQRSALGDAYDSNFTNLPNLPNAGSLKGYKRMVDEITTTNGDSRDVLLKSLANRPIDVQNRFIDKTSDIDIFNAVEESNGYGSRYIKYLRDIGGLTPEKANQFRKAMKLAGVFPFVVGTLNDE